MMETMHRSAPGSPKPITLTARIGQVDYSLLEQVREAEDLGSMSAAMRHVIDFYARAHGLLEEGSAEDLAIAELSGQADPVMRAEHDPS